jgi:hypothetical protein
VVVRFLVALVIAAGGGGIGRDRWRSIASIAIGPMMR